jgi:hypothetical protein
MSILNNTIVARMYHSEAILLPDGRVLISGSDPQTNFPNGTVEYPEEFRIEVLLPYHTENPCCLINGLNRLTLLLTSPPVFDSPLITSPKMTGLTTANIPLLTSIYSKAPCPNYEFL